MTNQQVPEAPAFCWATELAMTQQPVTLSVTEAREVSTEMQRLHAESEMRRTALLDEMQKAARQHAENETLRAKIKAYEDLDEAASDVQLLRMGYAAARLEIESLQARIKTMAEEHADELMVAHLDGRMRAAQQEAQEPVAWYVTGCSRLLDEDEAKAEARHIGGTARAIPLYTMPHADSQPAPVRGAPADLPPLPDPDLRDVGTKPEDIKNFLRGYATEYAKVALAAHKQGANHD